ncbi:MAG: RluA family pseudouridine synthase [Oscillospiraceae bacterium]|nr:RluA family pseudouridine synthase [Oscillospiraceae bacterium]
MRILFEDKHLLVAEKDAGILSEPDGSGNDIVTLCSQYTKSECFPVHRLDRGTGGVMVLAKTKQCAGKLSALVSERAFSKEYLAVIKGCPEEKEGVFKNLLFKDSRKNKSFVISRPRKGVKEASLEYRVLDSREETSLVLVKLHTGRTHQIRVQFASRKMPLLGDGKYGSRDNKCETALHSCRLSFKHPMTGQEVCCTSLPPREYPWDMFEIEI